MKQGQFVVVEGLEGAGKSTAISVIENELKAKNITFINTREPGGTPLAEKLRDLVKSDYEERLTPEAELMMMYASRVQLIHNVIQPALDKGIWVIGDRHDLSSQAYQGGGRQISNELLQGLKKAVLGDFKPDFTLYLDIDPKVGLARARGRGELDRIEKEDISFFVRTRDAYQTLANADSTIMTINAEQSMENVHSDVKDTVSDWLNSVAL